MIDLENHRLRKLLRDIYPHILHLKTSSELVHELMEAPESAQTLGEVEELQGRIAAAIGEDAAAKAEEAYEKSGVRAALDAFGD